MIIQTIDFLFAHRDSLQIVHELPIEDSLCLMGQRAGTVSSDNLETATRVCGHANILEACKRYLSSKLTGAATFTCATTAKAMAEAAADPLAVVVCPEPAGVEAGLKKLAHTVSDDAQSQTRYAIVMSRTAPEDVSSIALMPCERATRQCVYLHLAPRPGSLLKVLSVLFAYSADVATITSRPPGNAGGQHFENYFYLEYELPPGTTPSKAQNLSAALEDVCLSVSELSMFGGHICSAAPGMPASPSWGAAALSAMSI